MLLLLQLVFSLILSRGMNVWESLPKKLYISDDSSSVHLDYLKGVTSFMLYAGAAILVSLSRALASLFEPEEQPAKGLDSQRASGQKKRAVFL